MAEMITPQTHRNTSHMIGLVTFRSLWEGGECSSHLSDSISMLSKHPDHLETTPNQTTKQSTSTDTPEYTHRSSTPRTAESPPTNHHVITNFTRDTTSPNRPARHARTPRIQIHTSPTTINSTSTNQPNLHIILAAHIRASISFTSNKQTTSL